MDGDISIDDLDDESLAKLIEDAIGDDLDPSMLEEFRSSEFFEDFVKGIGPTDSNPASRRQSRDSDRGSKVDVGGNLPQQNAPPPAVDTAAPKPSTSGVKEKKYKSRGKPAYVCQPYSGKDLSGRKASSASGNEKNAPGPSQKERHNRSSNSKAKEATRSKPSRSIVKENSPLKDVAVSRAVAKKVSKTLTDIKPCSVSLCDLRKMKGVFPGGINSRTTVTSRMIQQIKSIEREIRSYAKKKGIRVPSKGKTAIPPPFAAASWNVKEKKRKPSMDETTGSTAVKPSTLYISSEGTDTKKKDKRNYEKDQESARKQKKIMGGASGKAEILSHKEPKMQEITPVTTNTADTSDSKEQKSSKDRSSGKTKISSEVSGKGLEIQGVTATSTKTSDSSESKAQKTSKDHVSSSKSKIPSEVSGKESEIQKATPSSTKPDDSTEKTLPEESNEGRPATKAESSFEIPRKEPEIEEIIPNSKTNKNKEIKSQEKNKSVTISLNLPIPGRMDKKERPEKESETVTTAKLSQKDEKMDISPQVSSKTGDEKKSGSNEKDGKVEKKGQELNSKLLEDNRKLQLESSKDVEELDEAVVEVAPNSLSGKVQPGIKFTLAENVSEPTSLRALGDKVGKEKHDQEQDSTTAKNLGPVVADSGATPGHETDCVQAQFSPSENLQEAAKNQEIPTDYTNSKDKVDDTDSKAKVPQEATGAKSLQAPVMVEDDVSKNMQDSSKEPIDCDQGLDGKRESDKQVSAVCELPVASSADITHPSETSIKDDDINADCDKTEKEVGATSEKIAPEAPVDQGKVVADQAQNPVSTDLIVNNDSELSPKPTSPESSSISHGGGDDDDIHECSPSPPEATGDTKSSSPERILKKKNVIESSSDDGDTRKDGFDDTDTTDHVKSSDEEQVRKSSFERKKEQNSRYTKFVQFEHERQRKMSEKKKEKEKLPKESDALDEILKEKPFTGSFKIPKKGNQGHRSKFDTRVTPLADINVPKENLTFEKSRKGSDKRERSSGDFRGSNFPKRDQGPYFNPRNRYLDDGRHVMITPEREKSDPVPKDEDPPEPEPMWGDDGGDDRSGGSDDFGGKAESVTLLPTKAVDDSKKQLEKMKDKKPLGENKEDQIIIDESKSGRKSGDPKGNRKAAEAKEKEAEEISENKSDGADPGNASSADPEVPVTDIKVNALATATLTIMDGGPECCQLPDVEHTNNLYEATIMKLAWWFYKDDLPGPKGIEVDSDRSDDSDCSFLDNLDLSDSDDNFIQNRHRPEWTPVDECCGRTLLTAEYRTGPDDTFSKLFLVRGGGSYDKENFQARCNLCTELVQGRLGLANHVLSEKHKNNMLATAGENPKPEDEAKKSRDMKDKESSKIERDKRPESEKGRKDKGELESSEKSTKRDSDKEEKKETEKGRKDDRKGDEGRVERRKRSRERERAEEKSRNRPENGTDIKTTTSTGLPVKIPAGAIPEKSHPRARGSRSRSRSPRHHRNRSRSPRRRHSKSRSPRSRRRRSRSRTPVTRIPRSPTAVRDHQRRRSTSAERVEKFLAKTNSRRNRSHSRSPTDSQSRKRRRRSRSKSPAGPVMPKRNNREFHEKLALTADGKWTDEMEQRWKLMEAEEAIFMEEFGEKSKALKEVPEKHPNYGEEWKIFWERRFQEVEQEGKDPEGYDYVPEWKVFWSKRLRELLDFEFEQCSIEIKRRHGMDFETLHSLRLAAATPSPRPAAPLNPVSTPLIVPATPSPVLNSVSIVPTPVPPPHVLLPSGTPSSSTGSIQIPEQTKSFMNPSFLQQTIMSMASGTNRPDGDDFVAKSMSISSGGSTTGEMGGARKTSSNSSKVSQSQQPAQPITAGDIISQWEKLKSGGGPRPAASPVPTNVPQSGLRLSGSKSVDDGSNNDSGSIASLDFNGFTLVQVLHLMSNNLEDQLSFFAPKVKDYFLRAEELDLKKTNKSNDLLHDEDFVIMLFHIRDRFMAMIRANILSRDVLQKLNHTVYALNSLLEHPLCQKHRSKIVAASAALDIEKQDAISQKSTSSSEKNSVGGGDGGPGPDSSSVAENKNSLLSNSKKEVIAKMITEFLLCTGRNDISDTELRELVRTVVPASFSSSPSPRPTTSGTSSNPTGKGSREGSSQRSAALQENDPQSWGRGEVTKTFNIATSRGVGSTVSGPSFPNMNDRYATPSNFDDQFERSQSSSESASGRRSPFSRRCFTGNPSPNTLRDKARPSRTKRYDDLEIPSITADQMPEEALLEVHDGRQKPDAPNTSENLPQRGPVEEVTIESTDTEEIDENDYAGDRPPKKSGLPPGILNMIMKERHARAEKTNSIQRNSEGVDKRKSKKRRRSKLRRKRNYSSSSSSSSSTDESYYRRERRRRRKKRRKKKRRHERDLSESEDSNVSTCSNRYLRIRRAPPLRDRYRSRHRRVSTSSKERPSYHYKKERDDDSRQRSGRRSATFIPSPPLSRVSSARSVTIRAPVQAPTQRQRKSSSDWDKVSEASLKDKSIQTTALNVSTEKEKELPKVVSVSEKFWSAKNDTQSLCSVSSNEIDPGESTKLGGGHEKIARQLRVTEREPGEISSSE